MNWNSTKLALHFTNACLYFVWKCTKLNPNKLQNLSCDLWPVYPNSSFHLIHQVYLGPHPHLTGFVVNISPASWYIGCLWPWPMSSKYWSAWIYFHITRSPSIAHICLEKQKYVASNWYSILVTWTWSSRSLSKRIHWTKCHPNPCVQSKDIFPTIFLEYLVTFNDLWPWPTPSKVIYQVSSISVYANSRKLTNKIPGDVEQSLTLTYILKKFEISNEPSIIQIWKQTKYI